MTVLIPSSKLINAIIRLSPELYVLILLILDTTDSGAIVSTYLVGSLLRSLLYSGLIGCYLTSYCSKKVSGRVFAKRVLGTVVLITLIILFFANLDKFYQHDPVFTKNYLSLLTLGLTDLLTKEMFVMSLFALSASVSHFISNFSKTALVLRRVQEYSQNTVFLLLFVIVLSWIFSISSLATFQYPEAIVVAVPILLFISIFLLESAVIVKEITGVSLQEISDFHRRIVLWSILCIIFCILPGIFLILYLIGFDIEKIIMLREGLL